MLSKLISTFAKKIRISRRNQHGVSCKPYSPLYFALIFGLKCQQDVGENWQSENNVETSQLTRFVQYSKFVKSLKG